jgi:hypothetical protein
VARASRPRIKNKAKMASPLVVVKVIKPEKVKNFEMQEALK